MRTLYQATRRAIYRIISQKELWPETGNREGIGRLFSHDSIILWTIHSYPRIRKRYTSYMKDPKFAHIEFVRLRNPRERDLFLKEIGEQA